MARQPDSRARSHYPLRPRYSSPPQRTQWSTTLRARQVVDTLHVSTLRAKPIRAVTWSVLLQGAGIAGPPEPWSLDYIRNLEATWGRILGISPADRNRLLALRMKTATQGDPYAYDMVRDDTKEFM